MDSSFVVPSATPVSATSFVPRVLHLATWSNLKSALMVVGAIGLIAWEVRLFSHAPTAVAAVKPELVGPVAKSNLAAQPILDAIAPIGMAESQASLSPKATPVAALQAHSTETAQVKAVAVKFDPALGTAVEHKRIAQQIARKFRVSVDAMELIVAAAYLAGRDYEVDPLLILGVMAVESRFNPFAESAMGAQGLMQVIPKFHMERFEEHGGQKAILNPVANINVGADILKEYIARAGGIEAGLKRYSGATGESDNGYAAKVFFERNELANALNNLKGVKKPTPLVLSTPTPVAVAAPAVQLTAPANTVTVSMPVAPYQPVLQPLTPASPAQTMLTPATPAAQGV